MKFTKRIISFMLALICVMMSLSGCAGNENKSAGIEKFNPADASERYKNEEYSDYIEAFCNYYNELIMLCDELIASDYQVLLKSDSLEKYHDAAVDECELLKNSIEDLATRKEILELQTTLLSTAYLVSSYNADNYFAVEKPEMDGIKIEAELNTSTYSKIVESIERARTQFTE